MLITNCIKLFDVSQKNKICFLKSIFNMLLSTNLTQIRNKTVPTNIIDFVSTEGLVTQCCTDCTLNRYITLPKKINDFYHNIDNNIK